jgi:HK97 family phage major capsid protein
VDILQHTEALRTERMRLINESKGVYDDAIEAKREARKLDDGTYSLLTAEEQAKVDRIDERIGSIDAEVRALDQRENREREAATARDAFDRQHGTEGGERKLRSEADALRAWAQGRERTDITDHEGRQNTWHIDIAAAEREARFIRQGASGEELRSLLWDTGSVGSNVPTTLSRTLYQLMTAGIAAYRMPTTKINTASGETMQFPRINAHGIATQVIAQGTAIGGTDPTFLKMTLDAFKYGQLVQVANEVIQDSGIDIVQFLGGNIARAISEVVDADLIAGTGTVEPLGMMAAAWTGAAGTVSTGGSLLTPSYENLVDLVYSVNDRYRANGSAAFLMRDATAGNLRKLRDGAGGTTGAVLWQPSTTNGITGGQPDALLSYAVYTDPNVASLASNARIVAFGDWNAYYVRTVGGVTIERSDDFAFNTDLVTFRGKTRVDGDTVDLTAANILKQSV